MSGSGSTCLLAGTALWVNAKEGLFSLSFIQSWVKTFCTLQALAPSLFLSLFALPRTSEGGMGSLTSPVSISASQNIHEICPTERLPFIPSPSLSAPHTLQPSTCRVSPLEGKKKCVQSDSFSALSLFTFCTYAKPQIDLPQGSLCYRQTQLSTPRSAGGFLHANCSHCLLDDTQ